MLFYYNYLCYYLLPEFPPLLLDSLLLEEEFDLELSFLEDEFLGILTSVFLGDAFTLGLSLLGLERGTPTSLFLGEELLGVFVSVVLGEELLGVFVSVVLGEVLLGVFVSVVLGEELLGVFAFVFLGEVLLGDE